MTFRPRPNPRPKRSELQDNRLQPPSNAINTGDWFPRTGGTISGSLVIRPANAATGYSLTLEMLSATSTLTAHQVGLRWTVEYRNRAILLYNETARTFGMYMYDDSASAHIIMRGEFAGPMVLFYNGESRLQTTSAGAQIIGSALAEKYTFANGVQVMSGNGNPEGSITAVIASMWLRADGSASNVMYVKTTGTGNTGWTKVV